MLQFDQLTTIQKTVQNIIINSTMLLKDVLYQILSLTILKLFNEIKIEFEGGYFF